MNFPASNLIEVRNPHERLSVWVIRDLEPLPSDPGGRRLLRAGMLCKALSSRGHKVTWFTSNFDHYPKRLRPTPEGLIEGGMNLTIQMISGIGYRRNISVRRVAHNWWFARKLAALIDAIDVPPDIIVVDVPTTEAAAVAVRYAQKKGIPSVLSIRDIWPDSFPLFFSPPFRFAIRLASAPMDAQLRYACRQATSLVGISDEYLYWGAQKGGRPISKIDTVIPLANTISEVSHEDKEKLRQKLGLSNAKKIITFAGTWGNSVNIGWFSKVAHACRDRSDVVFVLGGDGQDHDDQKAILSTFDNVVLSGWLNSHDLATLLEISDIGLLPYRANAPQSVPNKVFDYMAAGVFQIGTLGTAVAAIYDEANVGMCVEPTADAFVAAVCKTLNDPPEVKRETIRDHFRKLYSADVIYGAMSDHIEQVTQLFKAGRGHIDARG